MQLKQPTHYLWKQSSHAGQGIKKGSDWMINFQCLLMCISCFRLRLLLNIYGQMARVKKLINFQQLLIKQRWKEAVLKYVVYETNLNLIFRSAQHHIRATYRIDGILRFWPNRKRIGGRNHHKDIKPAQWLPKTGQPEPLPIFVLNASASKSLAQTDRHGTEIRIRLEMQMQMQIQIHLQIRI